MNSTRCAEVTRCLPEYLERKLPLAQATGADAHLAACSSCREALRRLTAVQGLLAYVQLDDVSTQDAELAAVCAELNDPADLPSLRSMAQPGWSLIASLSGAPWWFVSAALHLLVIALVGLLTMEIAGPQPAMVVIQDGDTAHTPPPALPVTDPPDRIPALEPNPETRAPVTADAGNALYTVAALTGGFPDGDKEVAVEMGPVDPPALPLPQDISDGHDAGLGTPDALQEVPLIGVDGPGSRGQRFGSLNRDGLGISHGNISVPFRRRLHPFGPGGPGGAGIPGGGKGGPLENAIGRALEWLSQHQDPDGHWDAVKFGGTARAGGNDVSETDVAVTGYCVLAFLGAGHTEQIGKYSGTVSKAIYWLKRIQGPDGRLSNNYGHAIAGMALAEAAGMGHLRDTVAAAQKAIDHATGKGLADHEQSSERYGWSYGPVQLLRLQGDLSNTGWAIMFLKSAKFAGLKVSPFAFTGAANFLDACEVGRLPGDPYSGHHYVYSPGKEKPDPESCAAQITFVGQLCRLFMGVHKDQLQHAVEWTLHKGGLPKEGMSLYYIYYGSLVSCMTGGETAQSWQKALLAMLLPVQSKGGGDDDGSWAPSGTFSDNWGRVGQTALSVLCLEAPWRY